MQKRKALARFTPFTGSITGRGGGDPHPQGSLRFNQKAGWLNRQTLRRRPNWGPLRGSQGDPFVVTKSKTS